MKKNPSQDTGMPASGSFKHVLMRLQVVKLHWMDPRCFRGVGRGGILFVGPRGAGLPWDSLDPPLEVKEKALFLTVCPN